MKCHKCPNEITAKPSKAERLPTGWKRHAEQVWCSDCWHSAYVLRAITLPVIFDGSRAEVMADLVPMWRKTTMAANWIMSQLFLRDMAVYQGGQLGPMPPIDDPKPADSMYIRLARGIGAGLPGTSVASLIQAMVGKYKAKRRDIVWSNSASLPSMRYPQPFPVHNQSWSVLFDASNRPMVSVPMNGGRWSLRLKGGPRYRRQLAAVRQMVDGSAVRGEMALFQQTIDGQVETMCKMVAWLPRPPRRELAGTLFVRTAPDALLVAFDGNGERLWAIHFDHVRRWQAEHARRIQRLSYDQKMEQRKVASFQNRRDGYSEKYHDRMKSAVQEAAAQIAGYVARNKFAEVRYNEADHSFCEAFTWFALRERLACKLDEIGVAFAVEQSAVPGDAEREALVKLNRKDDREKKWAKKAKDNIRVTQQLLDDPVAQQSRIAGSAPRGT